MARDSILMTSAPSSARSHPASGTATPTPRSTTRIPASAGPVPPAPGAAAWRGASSPASRAPGAGAGRRSPAGVTEKLNGPGAIGASPTTGKPVRWKKAAVHRLLLDDEVLGPVHRHERDVAATTVGEHVGLRARRQRVRRDQPDDVAVHQPEERYLPLGTRQRLRAPEQRDECPPLARAARQHAHPAVGRPPARGTSRPRCAATSRAAWDSAVRSRPRGSPTGGCR